MAANVPELFLDNVERRQTHAVRRPEGEPPVVNPSTVGLVSVIIALVLFGLAAALVRSMTRPGALPIEHVSVVGEFRYLKPEVLRELVTDAIDGGFFTVDVNAIRSRLLAEPWIRDAMIRRVWPDALQVTITEQVPVARWGDNGLINSTGDVFRPQQDLGELHLIQLAGPDGLSQEVLEHYRRYSAQFANSGLTITSLKLSERRAWTISTGDGVSIVIGRKDVEGRVQRFLDVYKASLIDGWDYLAAVDMRYTNGLALRPKLSDMQPSLAAATHK
ncbi:MAG: FtsQ-type POTRA domain-containing protein [Gammaproteobacteria bacterium]|nr:FtsQ-type POTRA domain-containing protein [Gammaproteobacteria bacterium]